MIFNDLRPATLKNVSTMATIVWHQYLVVPVRSKINAPNDMAMVSVMWSATSKHVDGMVEIARGMRRRLMTRLDIWRRIRKIFYFRFIKTFGSWFLLIRQLSSRMCTSFSSLGAIACEPPWKFNMTLKGRWCSSGALPRRTISGAGSSCRRMRFDSVTFL